MYLGFEPRSDNIIPRPERPPTDDVDPSAYIPEGMTERDRQALRNAGLEWTDTLGSVRGELIGWAARSFGGTGQNTFQRAGQNIHHFREGGGAPINLDKSEMDDLQSQTALFSAVERQFIDLIVADMTPKVSGTRKHFLAMNGNPDSPNKDTPWFGAYAQRGTGWFYAMGGFLLAYGAIAFRRITSIDISYRSYVYDRYNWDLGKETNVPSRHLSYLLNDTVMGRVAGITGPDDLPYFSSGEIRTNRNGEISGYEIADQYFVSDALLGALEESGDAQRYDINGTSRIQTVSVAVETGE